jgi:hypothetical protein
MDFDYDPRYAFFSVHYVCQEKERRKHTSHASILLQLSDQRGTTGIVYSISSKKINI